MGFPRPEYCSGLTWISYTLTYLSFKVHTKKKDIKKDPDEEWDEGIHRLRSGRVLSTRALSPPAPHSCWGAGVHHPPDMGLCWPAGINSEPLKMGIFTEVSSRGARSLTQPPAHPYSEDGEFRGPNQGRVLPVMSPYPGSPLRGSWIEPKTLASPRSVGDGQGSLACCSQSSRVGQGRATELSWSPMKFWGI